MLQSVQTALSVFEKVAVAQPIGVSELARELGLTKSTVQRCLVTLHEAGWIRPEGKEQTRWVITSKCFSLGRRVGDVPRLREVAARWMEQLRTESRESIHLVLPEGRDAVAMEALESPHTLRIFWPVGARAPLHVTAAGKAMLSRYAEEDLEAYLSKGLEPTTRSSITDARKLRAELKLTRERGWASTEDELTEGACSVAAAILDRQGRPIASLSISGPTLRMGRSVREAYGKHVRRAAEEIGREL
ncbi:IclR family transcriptional regulator [Vitiosangium sp. GDMCC 1.1324]|uniref:IclR family transcriptional regulator n=1 Tax=Vitiosangium sp. (strain GDMCC 1.1324) TaxID=2138576 RepID=UPI00130D7151|nr:IclR family transcriptional regulator [Vitiosangium sp. GDMCC 1.1324]